jgi:hypothetical protein
LSNLIIKKYRYIFLVISKLKTQHNLLKLIGTATKKVLATKSTTYSAQQGHANEKTTEGILKAARLGDLKMLTELHREGIDLSLHTFFITHLH